MKSRYWILVLCAWAFHAASQPLSPTPVSVSGVSTMSASGHSYVSGLSADRRYIVFLSSAKNLTPNDNLASFLDVFRHDLVTTQTVLVSHSANRTDGANADSRAPVISANGRWIDFANAASDLLPAADSNAAGDIFLTDATSLTHSLVSVTPGGSTPANTAPPRNVFLSDKPQMSADGRWIAFESFATNLTAESDLNNESDVLLRDTTSNRTVLISVALDGATTANGKSEIVSISSDGNYILFGSTATNLVANGPVDKLPELYLRDVSAGQTIFVQHASGLPKSYACRWGSLSRDSRFVLYKMEFQGNSIAQVLLYDRTAQSVDVVTTNSNTGYPIRMSPDARFIGVRRNEQRDFVGSPKRNTNANQRDGCCAFSGSER